MSLKQFDQHQKSTIVENASDIGFKESAKIARVHYTTDYDWQRQLDASGQEVYLSHQAHYPGRGLKEITEGQEKAIFEAWKTNPVMVTDR